MCSFCAANVGSEFDESVDFYAFGECLAAVQLDNFGEEVDGDFFRIEALQPMVGGQHGATGGQHIVVEQNDIVFGDGVLVYLYRAAAILVVITFPPCDGREFAGLAHGHKTGVQLIGSDGAQYEPSRFDADDFGDAGIFVAFIEFGAYHFQSVGSFENRCEVFEYDSFYGEVNNVSYLAFNKICIHISSGLFHVEHYLPKSTKRMLMSLGEMPGMREACAMVYGSIFASFGRASIDIFCRVL